jgi:hypothetical protein
MARKGSVILLREMSAESGIQSFNGKHGKGCRVFREFRDGADRRRDAAVAHQEGAIPADETLSIQPVSLELPIRLHEIRMAATLIFRF